VKRRRALALGVVALLGGLAGCGRKGDLELPPPPAPTAADAPGGDAPTAAEPVD